jgi:hypothetical protein
MISPFDDLSTLLAGICSYLEPILLCDDKPTHGVRRNSCEQCTEIIKMAIERDFALRHDFPATNNHELAMGCGNYGQELSAALL